MDDGQRYEFLLAGDQAEAADAAWAAIGSGYTVTRGTKRQFARIWLDTFDGRLRSAGLTLAYLTGTGGGAAGRAVTAGRTGAAGGTPQRAEAGELMLAGREGVTLRQPATLRLPSLIDAVPPGPLGDRLRPVIGVRALLAVARLRSSEVEWRILNDDQKTVVRAYLDRVAVAGADGAALPARLRLVPVRGYQGQADRVARLLAGVAGVTSDAPPELDVAVAAGGGTAPGRGMPSVLVHPGQDATNALAGLLLGLLTVAELNTPGMVDDVDTEFLHDFRVAVRRTRSAVKLAGDVLPDRLAARYGGEFKWLGDLTTPMRDLDTFLLSFDAMAGELAEAAPADLEPLRAYLVGQRSSERRKLLRGLRSARMTELATGWRSALVPLARVDAPARSPGGVTVAGLATDRLGRAWRRVARRAAAITTDSPPEALHDLRKRAKELRYLLELFAGACRTQPHRELVRDLKTVQDCLGDFQDAEVHRDRVRAYATAMMAEGLADAPAMLAMGELVARFGARQRRAAADSVIRVRRFVGTANRRRVGGLVRPA